LGVYFDLCGQYCRDLELRVVGILEIKLVQAKELKNKDLIGKSDPFAQVYIRQIPNRIKKTKTIVSGYTIPLKWFQRVDTHYGFRFRSEMH
jgi:hypothetical protein